MIPVMPVVATAWTTRSRREIAIDVMCQTAADHRIAVPTLRARTRRPHIVAARHDAWKRLRAAGYSYPEIGELFGFDHSTVVSACKKRVAVNGEAGRSER